MRRERFFPFLFCCVFAAILFSSAAFAYEVGDSIEISCPSCKERTQHTLNTYIPPTCSKNGTGKAICSVCNSVSWITFPKSSENHVWEVTSRTEPTLIAPGFIDYTCSQCGESKTESIPALPYDPSDSEHVPCTKCGELANVTNILKPATCQETGIVRFSCDSCGTSTYSQYGPVPSNHGWEETGRTPSACNVNGSVQYTCSICGEVKTEELPLSSEHTWRETGRTEPTATSEGVITYECSVCGTTKSESIPKLEECSHVWMEAGRTEPTATVPGSIQYTCSQCGESRTESIPVLPPEPLDPGSISFMNWLGSVVGLFNMTLNSIMGFPALRLFAGVLVFLLMFGLLVKLLQQGRKGRL